MNAPVYAPCSGITTSTGLFGSMCEIATPRRQPISARLDAIAAAITTITAWLRIWFRTVGTKNSVSRVEAAFEGNNCRGSRAGCNRDGLLQAARLPLKLLDEGLPMNLGNFPCWKTIFKSRMPVIEATDADKTSQLSDPVIHLSRAS